MRKVNKLLTILVTLSLGLISAPQMVYSKQEQENVTCIYVAENGNDAEKGTIDKPLRTLEGAKKRINATDKSAGGIKIILREGQYDTETGFELDISDSGTEECPISYEAYAGEKVSIRGGKKVKADTFSLVTDEKVLNRLPEEPRGKVYAADLAASGITDYGGITKTQMKLVETPSSTLLTVDDEMQDIAKWPNDGYEKITEVIPVSKGWSFKIGSDRIKRWESADSAWLYGRFMYDWADGTVQVKSINADEHIINTEDTSEYGIRAGYDMSIFNLLEELDIPGEWYIDQSTGMLYIFPKGNIFTSDIRLINQTSPLINMNNVSYLNFKNIIFEGTRGIGVNINEGGNNAFYGCEFRNIGQQGVYINNSIKNNFDHCKFDHLGKGGICIMGGDGVDLTPSENNIENCLFEKYAMIAKKYSYGVKMYGVGDRVAHCRIHDAPHFAIYFLGNNQTIEYNDIYDVTQDASDSSAVYAGRSWVNGGTVIKNNYIHDCFKNTVEGRAGLYFDDGMTDVKVFNNVFYNMNNGMSLHYSSRIQAENNLFINCRLGITLNNRNYADAKTVLEADEKQHNAYKENGYEWLKNNYQSVSWGNSNDLFKRYFERYVDNETWNRQYPYLKTLLDDGYYQTPKYNIIRNNAFLKHKETYFLIKPNYNRHNDVFDFVEGFKNQYENNIVFEGEAELSDEENGNVNLKDYSYICNKIKDFKPLDITEAGIVDEKNVELGNFNLVSPLNGEKDVNARDVRLKWETDSGANRYRLLIARDSEFSDIVFDDLLDGIEEYGHRNLTGLRFGRQTYYWKVQALTTSFKYDKTKEKWCDKVFSFTTAYRESINKDELNKDIIKAREAYDSAKEGTDEGMYLAGAKEKLRPVLESAENVLESREASSKLVKYTDSRLNSEYKNFLTQKNPEQINISELMSDKDNWGAGLIVKDNSVISQSTVNSGYFPECRLMGHHILNFKALFDVTNTGYISVGLRSSNVTVNPWLTSEYAFLVKSDTVEFQKFKGNNKYFYEKKASLSDGKIHNVQFSAVNEGEAVRVKLIIDGEEWFNVLDSEEPIREGTGLHICNSAGNTLKLYPADE